MSVTAHQFKISPLNEHYEGDYSAEMVEWRRIGAKGKARNLASLVPADVESVLEVGCGTGAVLAAVKALGLGTAHIGIDVADPDLHTAEEAKGLDLRSYDGARLPFADGSFDLVFASHVLEHVPDERGFLAELGRVSRKWIYIEVPCELHLRTSYRALQATLNIGHINAYTPESFLLTLSTSGLAVRELKLFDHSAEVHAFGSSPLKGQIKSFIRGALLATNKKLAARLLTYHCGALCAPSGGATVPMDRPS